jgi:hypothetical protein
VISGTSSFSGVDCRLSRNSYGSLLLHIYELVKLGSIGYVQYSDSEKTFKAFTEHGLARNLIARSYFL